MVKCTINDLDIAPKPRAGNAEPDEFDVNPFKVSELLVPYAEFWLMQLNSLLIVMTLLPTLTC